MVATCQIILDIVRHGYLEMQQINVLVFDEAHHAMKESPMHQLMHKYTQASESERPRVIGLTGMLLTGMYSVVQQGRSKINENLLI